MPQKCTICKITEDESEFNQLKRKVELVKSCKECNLEMYEDKKKTLELTYQHLWIRKDGSKVTDPWEIVDDHKRHNCTKCKKEKAVKEFAIYGSKCNPKLSKPKVCKIHNDYRRKEDERRQRDEFKEECYWNGHLIRRRTDHVSTPAKTACNTCEDSD